MRYHKRHLTADERATIRQITDEVGLVEMVQIVASMVGNDVQDVDTATRLRSAMMKVAGELTGGSTGGVALRARKITVPQHLIDEDDEVRNQKR